LKTKTIAGTEGGCCVILFVAEDKDLLLFPTVTLLLLSSDAIDDWLWLLSLTDLLWEIAGAKWWLDDRSIVVNGEDEFG
jgi:hypothetical protein